MSEYYPPPSFYFTVSVLGENNDVDAEFKEASGISVHMETEEIAMGGENRFKFKAPTRAAYDNLVLKRGLVISGTDLAMWCADTLGGGLVTAVTTKDIQVQLLNSEGDPLMTWTFVGAWPIKWEVSGLDSMENKLAIETLEFTYNYFTILEGTPSPDPV